MSINIPIQMIDVSLLQALVAFADCGTLSAAASELHTSQPVLTRSIQKLEATLGIALCRHQRNRLFLNETGEAAVRYARLALQEVGEFPMRVKAFDRSLHTISIGYCAPVPQMILTPILGNVFEGMTISADMKDDANFLEKLEDDTYQFVVVHEPPQDKSFHWKKCGEETIYLSIRPSSPFAFYPEVYLKDLNNSSVLLRARIGFWDKLVRAKAPQAQFLLQIEADAFRNLAANTDYPCFSSSYFRKRNIQIPNRTLIPLADKECHTDYYLVCLQKNKSRYKKLFDALREDTIS